MQTIVSPAALFASSWNLFKARWKLLVLIALVPAVAMYIGQSLFSLGGAALSIIGAILMLAGTIGSIALQPTLILIAQQTSVDSSPLSFAQTYKDGFRYFWLVLGMAIIHGLIIVGGALAFLIPALILEIYICFYIFCRILDGKKGLSAFTESYSLVKGRWFAVFGRILLLIAVYAAFSMVCIGILFLVGSVIGSDLNTPGSEPVSDILNLILNVVMLPLAVVYLHSLYRSLKATRQPSVRTEGFKKWLIFFLVLGIAAILLLPLIGFSLTKFVTAYPNIQ